MRGWADAHPRNLTFGRASPFRSARPRLSEHDARAAMMSVLIVVMVAPVKGLDLEVQEGFSAPRRRIAISESVLSDSNGLRRHFGLV
jgi:hypothetical protein